MTLSAMTKTHEPAADPTAFDEWGLPPGGLWGLLPASVPREFAEPTPELLARVEQGLRGWAA